MGALSVDDLVARLQKATQKTYSSDQLRAIKHGTGALWITAGPGSGKSEVLVARTLKLILCEGVDPASIMLTTFTEKAAANLEARIASYLVDLGYSDSVDATELRTGTLHSLCDAFMREHRYPPYVDLELLDEDSRAFFLYQLKPIHEFFKANWHEFEPLFARERVSKQYGPNQWASTNVAGYLFDRITEYEVDVAKMAKDKRKPIAELAAMYKLYQEALKDQYRCDFATLQRHFLEFLRSAHGRAFLHGDEQALHKPLQHLLVDEYQDTNPIQESIYFELARPEPHNLVVVGDDDQAMYRFRGGTVESLVQFGDRAKSIFGTNPAEVNLNENRRSHPGVVTLFNEYIATSPAMKKKGARAPGKRPMVAKVKPMGSYPPVCGIFAETKEDAAKILADLLQDLKKTGTISDWKNVGILFRSTREGPRNAGPIVDELRKRKVRVYNPRNRSLHEDSRIQQLLGALVVTLDRDLETLKAVRGGVVQTVNEWVDAYTTLSTTAEGKALAKYVERSHGALEKLQASKLLNTTVMDVLYRILAHEPFRTLKEDPNYGTRFGLITGLVDSFTAFTEGYGLLRTSSTGGGRLSYQFLQTFYYQFSGFLSIQGLNDPEDPDDLMPAGHVQVMTMHQAKGLEFPIVIVGTIDEKPKPGPDHWAEAFLAQWARRKPVGSPEDRAAQDLIRRYYVAYSRPQNLLILCGKRGSVSDWVLGNWHA
ncbi:MAG: UvrD-helicase domain-containing protein [Thermoplasmatota archaeon]